MGHSLSNYKLGSEDSPHSDYCSHYTESWEMLSRIVWIFGIFCSLS